MLAQMLQMEFDREYDAQLRREEKKFNGDSKGIVKPDGFFLEKPVNLLYCTWVDEGSEDVIMSVTNFLTFVSQVSISFENYRKVHPFEDSDSSEDEVDWQDTRHDPYQAGTVQNYYVCKIACDWPKSWKNKSL